MIFSTKGVVAALSYLQLVKALANAGSEADHCVCVYVFIGIFIIY